MKTTAIIMAMGLLLVCFSAAFGGEKLPHEFGDMVPLYPSAEVVDVRHTRNSVAVTFSAAVDPTQIIDYYYQELDQSGWRLIESSVQASVSPKGLQSVRDKIHLTLTCRDKKAAELTEFSITLDYPRGRE